MTNTTTTLHVRHPLARRVWLWVSRNRRHAPALYPDMTSDHLLRDIGIMEIGRTANRATHTHRDTLG